MRNDPIWVLESNSGWKVVYCNGTPKGGTSNGNWLLLADGLTWERACVVAKEFRS